ncbi:protein translocase subunit SecD [Haloglycomyces albus]|uniref:protein translocase subunit SecD n=1 Tax=Haloglycomyces albus TaxID=526067 RepID=UPI00046D8AB5|nr:protein translocase subunit SecD [Haloglycomyces albus]
MASKTGTRRPQKKIQRKRLRLAPYFLSLLTVIAILWVAAFVGSGNWKDVPTPKLGLDLQGGLSMTLTAYQDGSDSPPDEETMEQARQIIENRVNSTGVAEPEIYVEGDDNVVVNVAGHDMDEDALRSVGAPAELRFRIVSNNTVDTSSTVDEQIEAAEEGEEDAEEETSEQEATEDEDAAPEDSETGGDIESLVEMEREDASDLEELESGETLTDVLEKVGYEAANTAYNLSEIPTDPATLTTLKPFADLSAEEVALLPAGVQFGVPTISCEQLDNRPPGAVQNPDKVVTSCGETQSAGEGENSDIRTKYILAPADVLGSDVSDANVGSDPNRPNTFVVNVRFTPDGADRWGTLTNENVQNQVAIVLDNKVVSAPVIQAPTRDQTQITGDFTPGEAQELADQLNFGSLPTNFVTETVNNVTATLGVQQLKAGLIAGAIGLGLVFLYCLAYYRILGFIVLGSLTTATLILYPFLALLGSQIGLTLTLAGMAGFVVSIGITADSFVVYFERIKEEMKDGRSAKSAVPRAWERTRRTILSANAVSIISALVLYFLAIGPVQAFAFALGLSTLVNILVVFLFTHPIAELLARGNVLNNRRLSGLHTRLNLSTKPSTSATPSTVAAEN